MPDQALRAACPCCGKLSHHAIVPVPHVEVSPANIPPVGPIPTAKQRLVCTQCEKMWEAAIVPVEQMAQLQLAAESLVMAKRQLAMMRLILSKDQLERLEQERGQTIKLHRAA